MIDGLIAQSQAGNSDATLMLIEKFNPLLRKYAYKLYYDDAYDDLLADFIELLHNLKLDCVRDKSEGSLVSYIYKSIYSSYIKRLIALKKLHNCIPESNLSDQELYYVESSTAGNDVYFENELPGIGRILTKSEVSVIKMIYISGFTVKETAYMLGITRQAVNQRKMRALKKLKAQLVDKP